MRPPTGHGRLSALRRSEVERRPGWLDKPGEPSVGAVHTGAGFAQALGKLDAVDEYRLVVCLRRGSGPRLFVDGIAPRLLELVSSRRLANGVFKLTLRRD